MEVCRIWWPLHLADAVGILYGFTNLCNKSSADVVVVTAVPAINLQNIEELQALTHGCGNLCVVGSLLKNGSHDSWRKRTGVIHLTLSWQENNNLNIPKLEAFDYEGKPCKPKLQFIVYRQPKFDSHHFSLEQWDFFPSVCKLQGSILVPEIKKPYWIHELEEQERGANITMVIQQINCAGFLHSRMQQQCFSYTHDVNSASLLLRYIIGAIAGIYFVVAQAWFSCAGNVLQISSTVHSFQIRLEEFCSWPSRVFWRSEPIGNPNVAVEHRLDVQRHSSWSKIAMDMILGILLGTFMCIFQSYITVYIEKAAHFLTNEVLRTGCVWLMGVPAGFKLNNELAEVIGTASLNIIQAFSTLWSYYWLLCSGWLIKFTALLCIIFGGTLLCAFIDDILFLATLHITLLQRVIGFVYGNQIKLLAALWRMFRGRKFNPLRTRTDSYEYSVEQLVVASLLFTPLLLLLPTTSVFYTFFTILYTSIWLPRFLLQTIIASLNFFPYREFWIWVVARGRLPSGLKFHIEYQDEDLVVSTLDSRVPGLGDIMEPFLKRLCLGLNQQTIKSIAFNLVTGGRLPLKLDFGLKSYVSRSNLTLKRFIQLVLN